MTIRCENCEMIVDAHVLAQHGSPKVTFGYGPAADYVLLRCPRCEDLMLVRSFSTYTEYDERVWPPERSASLMLPRVVGDSLNEALRCLEAKRFLPCVLMCRRTLELLCKHFYPSLDSLGWGLKKLHHDGVIDRKLLEWAELLRESGNLAAHDPSAEVDGEDADDLIDFTEAILNYVFLLSARFETFKRRRASSAGNDRVPDDSGGA